MKCALVAVVTLVSIITALPCSAASIGLDIAPAASVKGPQVTLGDIAVVRCDDPTTAAKLQAIPIGAAPMPGKSRSLDTAYIKVRLRQRKFDPAAINTTWPEAVVVTTRALVIAGAHLVAAGKEAVLAQAPGGDGETVITCNRVPPDMMLPEGALDLKAELLGSFVGASRLVKVTAVVDGQPCASHTICYRVQRFADVVVARKGVDRGKLIADDDVARERREIDVTAGNAPYDDTAKVVGLRATRALRPGDIITRASVAETPAIKRGDKVWVTAVCGSIRVAAEAIACADAAAGSSVRLKNPTTGETFLAKIDAEGRASVTP